MNPALWTKRGQNWHIETPTVTAVSDTNKNWREIYLEREVRFTPSLDVVFDRALEPPIVEDGGVHYWNDYRRTEKLYDDGLAVLQEPPMTAVLRDIPTVETREENIFWAGIGLGVILALLVSVLSKMSDAIIDIYNGRK